MLTQKRTDYNVLPDIECSDPNCSCNFTNNLALFDALVDQEAARARLSCNRRRSLIFIIV